MRETGSNEGLPSQVVFIVCKDLVCLLDGPDLYNGSTLTGDPSRCVTYILVVEYMRRGGILDRLPLEEYLTWVNRVVAEKGHDTDHCEKSRGPRPTSSVAKLVRYEWAFS